MNLRRLFLLPALAALPLAISPSFAAEPDRFAIVGARVFDGENVLPRATVLVEGGKILAVGPEVKVPAGVPAIDGAGKTLLPGLIDSHAHPSDDALSRALFFGVTTELCMYCDPAWDRARREEQARDGAPGRADLRSAGTLATAPGGHGTQGGATIPTVGKPEDATAWVAARLAEGSDFIKIAYEDGATYANKLPPLDPATLRALVEAAHAKGKLAVVHVSTEQRATEALEAGADGLVHVFGDRAPGPAFPKLAREKKAFVVPTLTVLESVSGVPSGKSLVADSRLASYIAKPEAANLESSLAGFGNGQTRMEHATAAVRALRDAGVPILAGTDAGNPGTAHGLSLHRELEMLVQAGLSPIAALTAATSAPAKAFGLTDRGRIAPGRRADLLLVEGDPTVDVLATRAIAGVWKLGVALERKRGASAP